MRKILLAIVVLGVLFSIWFFYKPPQTTVSADIPPAFQALLNARLDEAAKLKIESAKGPPVELAKAGGKWVVASTFGYPADGEKVDKIIKALDAIEKGERRGSAEAAQAEFKTDAKQAATITAYGADQKELARVIVGNTASTKSLSRNFVYLRFGDDPTTFEVESDLRTAANLYSKVEGKNYLLKKVLSFGDDLEPQSVRLTRPEKPDILVERRWRDVPVAEPKDPAAEPPKEGEAPKEEKKPETKKEEYFVATTGPETLEVKEQSWVARDLVDRVKRFEIDDAVEPKDLKEYGLDQPQLKATVTYRKKDKPDDELKTVTFLFGNARKDDKGTTTGYYAVIEAGEEHKGRVYLVQEYQYSGWNKELKDFQPKPKEEPKPAPAAGEAPAGNPATTPSAAPADPGAAPESQPAPAPAPAPPEASQSPQR